MNLKMYNLDTDHKYLIYEEVWQRLDTIFEIVSEIKIIKKCKNWNLFAKFILIENQLIFDKKKWLKMRNLQFLMATF